MGKKAFTILELVIVLSVLVILIGIAIPRIKGMQQAGQIAQVKAELQTMQTAVESYYSNSSPHMYPGASNAMTTTLGANYLTSATPQIISSPLYDPFNPTASTEYNYYLSTNGAYYVISSIGPNGAWGCFVPGTKILLADGKTKTIESLKAGDVLLGAQQAHNKVVLPKIMPKEDWNIYAFNGGRYFVTRDHLFMTKQGWKAIDPKPAQKQHPELKVGQLQVGDEFVTRTGIILLKKIDFKILKNAVVYNPQLDGSHDYYADGFLVHNASGTSSSQPPSISTMGVVTKTNGSASDDICVTNGSGC
jgi:prepilin-type N-terminal cleavage/methylation domain-containing protein